MKFPSHLNCDEKIVSEMGPRSQCVNSSLANPVRCQYNVVRYDMIFHTALKWLRQNINQRLNSPQGPGDLWGIVRIWKKTDCIIKTPHRTWPHLTHFSTVKWFSSLKQENQDTLNLNILYYSYFPTYEGISNYDNDLFHNTWTYVSSLYYSSGTYFAKNLGA